MPKTVDTADLQRRLSTYVQRAQSQRERFLLARDGRPIAALVSVEDLERLEALDAGADRTDETADRLAIFRQALDELGMVIRHPSGAAIPLSQRVPLTVDGPPLSEQIIAERR